MEHIYKSVARYIYAFQRTHFEVLQLLELLDGDERRFVQEAPSPQEFVVLAAEVRRLFAVQRLDRQQQEVFDTLLSGLDAVGGLNRRLMEADFRLPERDITLATEACGKVQLLLRQCRQILLGRSV